ncbi:hypothetical protein [Pedobacter duraquae]|uniref:Uncharacterized protein n=1 Tax=Pedobacter duraquae TaxID=425511 RepID=A0A4R6IAX4_9SPHI|nr:hypothetical protein [Pedobacter duraquae]TDO19350.1 hypothetical protein CLV32_4590 [Pedobacter duraquae]
MATDNQQTVRIRWLFGNKNIQVEMLSAITSMISTFVGVAALFIGVWQFNLSLEKTDIQIKFLENEKIERNAENRPIVRFVDFTVDKEPHNWSFKSNLVNEGKRQADSLITTCQVLAYDGSENLSNSYIVPMYERMVIKQNGLFPQESLRDSKKFDRIDLDVYLVRIDITYRDVVSKDKYPLTKYFKIDLKEQPVKITDYYEEQKYSDNRYHDEFHRVFDVYFPHK